jgi:ATPase subunit of ABC transporter with duplicated ATPase domains
MGPAFSHSPDTPGYLPQGLTLRAGVRVGEALGIAGARRALLAIERAGTSPERYAAVGDGWDVDARARAMLGRLGLGHVGLDRRVGEVSGGEAVLLALAAVAGWRGVLVVVSHDREVLGSMDRVAGLRDSGIRFCGGNLAAYEQAVATEQEAAQRSVRAAESDVRRQRRELIEAQTELARRSRYGQKIADSGSQPKIVMAARKRQAQVSAGKHRILHAEKVAEAQQRLAAAERGGQDHVAAGHHR